MLVYFQPETAPLAGVPKALMERRLYEYIQGLSAFGVRYVGAGDDSSIQYDVSRSTAENIYQWLERDRAVCVDVQPADLAPYAGVSRGTDVGKVGLLAAQKLLATDQQAQLSVSRILPGEIPDRVAELFLRAVFSGPEQPARPALSPREAADQNWLEQQEEEQMVSELRQAGISVPDRYDEPEDRDPLLDEKVTPADLDLTPSDDWGV